MFNKSCECCSPVALPGICDCTERCKYRLRFEAVQTGAAVPPVKTMFSDGVVPICGGPDPYWSANTKPSNPKDAIGVRKVGIHSVPMPVLWELAVGMTEGGCKYGTHNYREAGVRASVYFDACFRHLSAWWEGENIDADSGLSHVTKAIASLVVLRDSMIQGNWVDDRPPSSDPKILPELNKRVEVLADKYPNPVRPYTKADLSFAQAKESAA